MHQSYAMWRIPPKVQIEMGGLQRNLINLHGVGSSGVIFCPRDPRLIKLVWKLPLCNFFVYLERGSESSITLRS